MKAEINNENKAKFFALYWGQNLVCVAIEDVDDKKGFDVTDWVFRAFTDDCYLSLKPLSSISDEDAIKIGFNSSEDFFRFEQRNVVVEWYDDLRYLGYAIPWMGLSVEEMREAGWIKLK